MEVNEKVNQIGMGGTSPGVSANSRLSASSKSRKIFSSASQPKGMVCSVEVGCWDFVEISTTKLFKELGICARLSRKHQVQQNPVGGKIPVGPPRGLGHTHGSGSLWWACLSRGRVYCVCVKQVGELEGG